MNLDQLSRGSESRELGISPFYVSFSDLVVLLLVFFVMLVGMSEINTGSFETLKAGFTGSDKGTLVELAKKLHRTYSNRKGLVISMAKDGVRLDLDSAALFSTGSSVLKQESLRGLQPIFTEIKATSYQIDVEGHSDDVPYFRSEAGEIHTNWSLSGRRASAVVNYLIGQGFADRRLRIVGYASTKPKFNTGKLSGASLRRARARNRRVSILIR